MAITPGTEPILKAASVWKDKCLIQDLSVFTFEQLWTAEHIDELQTHFVDNLDMGDRGFDDKLYDQLSPTTPEAKRLAAEMLWLLWLFPDKINQSTKSLQVRKVWGWSGSSLSNSHELLIGPFEHGIGRSGTAYMTLRWLELSFLIRFVRRWKTEIHSIAERQKIAADPWLFAQFLDKTEGANKRQFRHMLLHMLFPESFERAASRADRVAITQYYQDQLPSGEHNRPGDSAALGIDRRLLAIRGVLARQSNGVMDFYHSPWREQWKPKGLKESISQILARYVTARTSEQLRDHPLQSVFRNLSNQLGNAIDAADDPHIHIQYSFGKGNWANVPWISIRDDRAAASMQNGVYCVYLFLEDMSGVYLTYNQGVTDILKQYGDVQGRRTLQQIAERLRPDSGELSAAGFKLDNDIDLRVTGGRGDAYQDSTIAYKFYSAGNIPDDESLIEDLEVLVGVYKGYVSSRNSTSAEPYMKQPPVIEQTNVVEQAELVTPNTDLAAIHISFSENLRQSNIQFGSKHDSFIRRFLVSLATKRFAILTGLSGSGKTQIALRFGEWCGPGQFQIVPVRPDWTGAEALFGYEDALLPVSGGQRAWHVPQPLAFMLRAASDPRRPYVLILDEMNLAHVERYFADVLSGMESGAPCLPNLVKSQDGYWYRSHKGRDCISIPKNLFVIGTVNVDETTYMFSPKVLDRANTLEFRVSAGDLSLEARKPTECLQGPADLVAGLLQLAQNEEFHISTPHSDLESYKNELLAVHRILERAGFEFAHRVFFEAVRFASLYQISGNPSWKDALDIQILQKILPRLHGSRKRLEPTLEELGQFCAGIPSSDGSRFDPLRPLGMPAKFPESFAKIARMTKSVRTNQFASFTE